MRNLFKHRFLSDILFVPLLVLILLPPFKAEGAATVTTNWGGGAGLVYDTGFMQMLMKQPSPSGLTGGVCLFNMELVENDAPGSGYSEKGVDSDVVWGQNRARKILRLDDPRAEKAWFVALFEREAWFLPASKKSR